jgi:hypothetical protein
MVAQRDGFRVSSRGDNFHNVLSVFVLLPSANNMESLQACPRFCLLYVADIHAPRDGARMDRMRKRLLDPSTVIVEYNTNHAAIVMM